MGRRAQRASTLAETAIALAIFALVGGASLGALAASSHAAGGDPRGDALQQSVAQEMRIARDVLKYEGAVVSPVTVATSLPMPADSPLPATLSIAVTPEAAGSWLVSIQAGALDGSGEVRTLQSQVSYRAPLPGAQISAGAAVPAPTGAP